MQRNDQDVIKDGRKNTLKDVEVSLREQSLKKLVRQLEDMDEGVRTVQIWDSANSDRTAHLDKQKVLLREFDEFIRPIYTKSQEWMSDLHLPITFTVCKTYHARFLAALLSVDPSFSMKARQAAYEEKVPVVQDVMRYTLNSWVNYYKGIDEVLDQWLWRWVTSGQGILKQRWERKFERYVDVVTRDIPGETYDTVDIRTGETVTNQMSSPQEVEEEVTHTIYDGPIAEEVAEEDIVIVGGKGDPDCADSVIESIYMTASDLWTLADQGIFNEDVVKDVIESGENSISGQPGNDIKVEQSFAAGQNSPDKEYDLDRYQILERYAKLDVNGSGINTEVILWVHKETKKILRATYLRRVCKSGLRPYTKIEFHKRNSRDYPVGIPELLYTLTKEIDAIHNLKIDIGIQTSLPFGFYRPSSSMSEKVMSYGPGELIPLDNPQSDVYFPNLGNRTGFSIQEEASLMNQIDRLTSISDLSLGIIGAQGASRTATGTRALLGESNANLDVFLRRLNRGWKRFLIYQFHQLQDKLPPGFEFRVFGDDGKSYFRRLETKQELCGMFDFELDANSANSNQTVRVEQSNQIYQLTGNPLDYQLGIFTPMERYESIKNLLLTQGVRDFGRFVRKPSAPLRVFTPLEIANRVLAHQDIPFDPSQDVQGYIDWFEHVMKTDELLGFYNETETVMLFRKYQEAQAMGQALAAQQAQQANRQQVATNSAMATGAPSALPPGAGPTATTPQTATS